MIAATRPPSRRGSRDNTQGTESAAARGSRSCCIGSRSRPPIVLCTQPIPNCFKLGG